MSPPDEVSAADGLFILKAEVDAFASAPVTVNVDGAGPTVNLGDMTNPQQKKLLWLLIAAVVLFALLKKK
jgi:hypothetical protein